MTPELNHEPSTQEKLLIARDAAPHVRELSTAQKNAVLLAIAHALEHESQSILAANRADLDASGLPDEMQDRLALSPARVAAMAQSLREVAALPDPVGQTLAEWQHPNGLHFRKVRVPLGVVGIIYESRPNVTVDAIALAFKAGNAIVLRGGKEAARSNHRLVEIASRTPGIPAGAIQLLDSQSRDSVEALLKARGLVDVIIPRGGAGLIDYVVKNSTVPVIETGAGNCHIYVDQHADLDMADRIILNAKIQRPSVCNAAEKLLIHRAIANDYVPRIVQQLLQQQVEVRGDAETVALSTGVHPALPEDWDEEYLRLCIAIKIVTDVDEAIAHISQHSTNHSESIVTRDESVARRFLQAVDSAVVYWNASTRFTDGGEFGFGSEMGVSTQKLHCRGPFALTELTSSKYEVVGVGQVRS
jgi:glutamate-5-semialdehyde dehydrogenase